jgi:hypothetical protein
MNPQLTIYSLWRNAANGGGIAKITGGIPSRSPDSHFNGETLLSRPPFRLPIPRPRDRAYAQRTAYLPPGIPDTLKIAIEFFPDFHMLSPETRQENVKRICTINLEKTPKVV